MPRNSIILLFLLLASSSPFAHAQTDGLPRGAHRMPFVRYEAEAGTHGGGSVWRTADDFDHGNTAVEASGRRYLGLAQTGAHVEWAVTNTGDGLTLRFTLPDNATGDGVAGSLNLHINGTNTIAFNLSSYWAWTYFVSSHPRNQPGVRPRMRFDEARVRLPFKLQPGDVLRIQKDSSDPFEYGIDFIELEDVPPPLDQPAGYVSVTSHGATGGDAVADLAAFSNAWQAARAAGTGLYIPPGYFVLPGKWNLGDSTNMRVQGAGIWYTELHFNTRALSAGGIRTGKNTSGLELSHMYLSTILNARHLSGSTIVDYKAFDGVYTGSRIHNTWITHFETGPWIGDYASPVNPTFGFIFESNRVHNTYADGLNFTQGTRNSIARHNSFRDNGDDAIAIWAANTAGAPVAFSNTFHNNTIEFTYRAGGVGIFGGYGHLVHHNIIRDGIGTSGIRFTEDFPGYLFQNNASIRIFENSISARGTSLDLWNLPRGAIEISGPGIQHLYFENNDILDSPRHAIHLRGGSNLYFTNTSIRVTGLDHFNDPPGAAVRQYDRATIASFRRLAMTDIEADPPIRVEAAGSAISIISEFPFTDTSSVGVPEGGNATFGVRLSFPPAGLATVVVHHASGDPDISVLSGSPLIFNSANWNTYQTVTLATAEDDDFVEGTAMFEVRGLGFESTFVTATEIENDINHPPQAIDDVASTDEDQAVIILVLDNDTDQDGNPLTIHAAANGQHGAASHNGNYIVYVPIAGFHGEDRLTYVVTDGLGGYATGHVHVTVREVIAQNPYRMDVSVPGYTAPEPLTNFPLLIKLHPGITGFAYAQFASPLGHDLRFTDAQAKLLAYEIEAWNPGGASIIWVQVPLLTNQTIIHASWGAAGNAALPDYATNGAAWSYHYDAVYHVNEDVGPRHDSSPNRRDGLPFGVVSAGDGIAARANRFPGNGDYIELPSTFARFNGFVPLTVEFWFNAAALGTDYDWQYSPVLFQGNGESAWMVTLGDGFTRDTLGNRVDQGTWATPVTTAGIQSGRWYHVATTYEPAGDNNWKLHLNGQRVAQANRTGLIGVLKEKNAIGGNTVGMNRWFDGLIDEVRVSTVARSSNYVHASWLAMASNDTFIAYGTVTGPPPPDVTVLIDFGNTNSWRGFSVTNPDAKGVYWNSIWSGTFYDDVIDFTNGASGISFGFDAVDGTDSYNGPDGDIDAAALDLLGGAPNAVNDYYTSSRFVIGNLDPGTTYTLTFFGSHKYSDDDATRYTVFTDNTYATPVASIDLDVQTPGTPSRHNRDRLAILQSILPGTNGTLHLSFAGVNGGLGYLNAMKIEARRAVQGPYDIWAEQYTGLGGPADDDDADGINNYAEFVFGGDPLNSADRGLGIAAQPVIHEGTNAISLTYPRRKELDQFTWTIESTTNLLRNEWITPPHLTFPGIDSMHPDFSTVSNIIPYSGDRMYLRLNVTK